MVKGEKENHPLATKQRCYKEQIKGLDEVNVGFSLTKHCLKVSYAENNEVI